VAVSSAFDVLTEVREALLAEVSTGRPLPDLLYVNFTTLVYFLDCLGMKAKPEDPPFVELDGIGKLPLIQDDEMRENHVDARWVTKGFRGPVFRRAVLVRPEPRDFLDGLNYQFVGNILFSSCVVHNGRYIQNVWKQYNAGLIHTIRYFVN